MIPGLALGIVSAALVTAALCLVYVVLTDPTWPAIAALACQVLALLALMLGERA